MKCSWYNLSSKRERSKRRVFPNGSESSGDVFDYIGMLYNPYWRHGSNERGLSPVKFEQQYLLSV
jgi:transposase InsO family protein